MKREKIGKPHGKETRTYKNWIKISQLFKEIEEGKLGKTSGRKRRGIVWDKRRCNLNGRKKGITMNEARRRERERVRKKI